jgi:hypothetical protein
MGPHAGQAEVRTTDVRGIAAFTYTGSAIGHDTIEVCFTDPFQLTHSYVVHKSWLPKQPARRSNDRQAGGHDWR